MAGAVPVACVAHARCVGVCAGPSSATGGDFSSRQTSRPAASSHPRRFANAKPRRPLFFRDGGVPRTRLRKTRSPHRHETKVRVTPLASQLNWWDVTGRLAKILVEASRDDDDRSENGYLEHDSPPVVKFDTQSQFNGAVTVVAHGPWRSLRFNEVEQGLTYVTVDENKKNVKADVDVLGYEYLRCMTAAACSICALDRDNDWERAALVDESTTRPPGNNLRTEPSKTRRIICVGLGSGAMPAFIASKFPNVKVEVVEIDPVVVCAVREFHGVDFELIDDDGNNTDSSADPGLGVVLGDAGPWMQQAALAVLRGDEKPACAIFLDAFDGDGETPAHLLQDSFLENCYETLAPGGVVVANAFNGVKGSLVRKNAEQFAVALEANIGQVYSWNVETPVNVVFLARKGKGSGGGATRKSDQGADVGKENSLRFSRTQLKDAAYKISTECNFEWDAGDRVKRAFWVTVDRTAVANGDSTLIKEAPAGLDVNPLSRFAEALGTSMPPEWEAENLVEEDGEKL